MNKSKTYVVKLSNGEEVRIKAVGQAGISGHPFFLDEDGRNVAGFNNALGWWEESVVVDAGPIAIVGPQAGRPSALGDAIDIRR